VFPGEILGDRFEIERTVSSGGMGVICQARDRLDGGAVAIKVLGAGHDLSPRFTREIGILASLRHPGIVRYVAHGALPSGSPWLAMEWLEGPTLSARLGEGPLSVAEAVTLGGRLAGALGAFHQRGGVHRDVKPDNVILAGGEIEGATLIDFGVARLTGSAERFTAPGVMVGTARYMAPEQVRGLSQVDARADVFSLGTVLFRGLTGRSAFDAENELAVLFKILLEEPPLAALRAAAPPWLSAVVASMLAKSPGARPADGSAVAEVLATSAGAAYALQEDATPPPSRAPLELTSRERRVLCLLLTTDRPAGDTTAEPDASVSRALGEIIGRHRGRAELLADRSLLAVFTGPDGGSPSLRSAGSAADLAVQASRCALSMAPLLAGAPVVVVTGRAALEATLPVGELIERAVALHARAAGVGSILLDDVTVGLLGPQFDVSPGPVGPILRGERGPLEAPRTLLGKPTPCVGRDRELERLEDALARCIEEGAARAVLVTGQAGLGKSRLLYELRSRLRERTDPVEVWCSRGDPVSAGSPFGMLGQALRGAAGLLDGEPLEARRRKLVTMVGALPSSSPDAMPAVEFLGELCGVPFPDEGSGKLRLARRDPMVMGQQMARAFEDLLRAACATRPIALVLEDLHWGDGATVRIVDGALRNLHDRPFFVLAGARPEVDDAFPGLFRDRAIDRLRLAPLTRRASETLAHAALGASGVRADASVVRNLAERADGNAFYLEELIRAVAAGRTAELPETVLAMVQARLERLDPEARRILRAASIFGQRFRRGGVSALVGGAPVDRSLADLEAAEVISSSRDPGSNGEVEYTFRHALVREAAYGMLTEEDRAVGHKLAGSFLETSGEGDAMVLAECFERGGELGRAATWYRRAAELAFEGNDLDLAVARAERAIACAGDDPDLGPVWLGRVYLLEAQANRWRGQLIEGLARGLQAMRALPPGSAAWWDSAAEVVTAANAADPATLEATSQALLTTPAGPPSPGRDDTAVSCATALAYAAIANFFSGNYARGAQLLARSEAAASRIPGEPAVAAHVDRARGMGARLKGDAGAYLARMRSAGEHFEEAGDLRGACQQSLNVGNAYLQLGMYGVAERTLQGALREADRLGLQIVRAHVKLNLCLALALQGKLAEAVAAGEEGLALAAGSQRAELFARIFLARSLLSIDPARAIREIRSVSDDPAIPAPPRAYALALLGAAYLALDQIGDAVAAASRAMDQFASLGEVEEGGAYIHLTWIEALVARGDLTDARTAVAAARDRLLHQAAQIAEVPLRRSFLERVPENARTLSLARELLDEAG
jgi:eukaryotic-like serine/threonine-protein kinase